MFDRELRDLSHVPRWGILRCCHPQSVAEHSYYVTIYCIEIADFIWWAGDKYMLLRAALAHDIPEVRLSDIPGPTKRSVCDPDAVIAFEVTTMQNIFPQHSRYFRPEGEARRILTAADLLEATLYLAGEFNLGNRSVGTLENIHTPMGANYERLRASIGILPCAEDTRRALMDEVTSAIGRELIGYSRVHLDPPR